MNYLVFRNDGIGDLIVTSPVFEHIKKDNKKNNIYLVCSNRNFKYALELKNSGLIDKIINSDDFNKASFKNFKLIKILRKLKIDVTLIYKINSKNILLSYFSKSDYVYSILPVKNSVLSKKKYKIPHFLSKLIFNGVEYIDERDNYCYQNDIHMGDHFFNLYDKSISIKKCDKKNNYPKLSSLEIFHKKNLKILDIIKKNKKSLIFHLDEKWSDSGLSSDEIYRIFKNIKKETKNNYVILITTGNKITEVNKYFIDKLKINEVVCQESSYNINHANVDQDIYLLSNLDITDLISIISLSDLVIEPHGSLTHICGIYNIPVIDIIKNDTKNFFNKWRPVTKKHIQIEYRKLTNIEDVLKKFI